MIASTLQLSLRYGPAALKQARLGSSIRHLSDTLFLLLQALRPIAMADMGLRYDMDTATKGMAEGNVKELEHLHDPGRMGTKVSSRCMARCWIIHVGH